jgi:hypothetical protein
VLPCRTLKPVNVLATLEMLRLACQDQVKPLGGTGIVCAPLDQELSGRYLSWFTAADYLARSILPKGNP